MSSSIRKANCNEYISINNTNYLTTQKTQNSVTKLHKARKQKQNEMSILNTNEIS